MNELEKAMAQARVSTEMEGLKIKPEFVLLVNAVLNKQITEEEFKKKVKELVT